MTVNSTNPNKLWAGMNWPLLALIVAALPTVALFAVRFIAPSRGPATANAAVANPSPAFIPPQFDKRTEYQKELERSFADQASQPFGPTPIVERPIVKAEEPKPVKTTPVVKPAAPTFHLTSIMIARGEHIAIINGRRRSVGEEVVPGWTVQRIDGAIGEVVITDGGEESVLLTMRPKLGE
jgi:hypothetical protein